MSGRDLTWFFDEVYRSSNVFDYGVGSLSSERRTLTGLADGAGRRLRARRVDRPGGVRDEVIVRRYGEAVFPVDRARDLRERQHAGLDLGQPRALVRARFLSSTRAVSAVVDPGEVLRLDVNRTNNSVSLQPEGPRAATKWALPWLVVDAGSAAHVRLRLLIRNVVRADRLS